MTDDKVSARVRRAKNLAMWTLFTVASLVTVLTYNVVWIESNYFTWLPWLGLLSFLFGILVLGITGPNRWSVTVVIAGLIIGQWWFVKTLIVFASMAWGGFAP
jgi:hypothetical protein